jgi:serine/threonine-protein kinase
MMQRNVFQKENLKNWDNFLNDLFDGDIPERYEWNDLQEIILILNKIGIDHNLNHMFFPDSGGHDLHGAADSVEDECIELHFSSGKIAYIVKPDKLSFESFGSPYEWAYFRLETKQLSPSGVYDDYGDDIKEEIIEISPGRYAERRYWDEGFYGYDEEGEEKPLSDGARIIIRYFSGSLVIFAKGSIYNIAGRTYDGRHNKMPGEEFKNYIDSIAKGIN